MKIVKRTFKLEELDRECELFIEVADAIRDGTPLSALAIEYLRYVGPENYLEVRQRLPTAYNFFRGALSEEERKDLDYAYQRLHDEVCAQLVVAYTEGVKRIIRSFGKSPPKDSLDRLYDLTLQMSRLGLENCEAYEKATSIVMKTTVAAGLTFIQEESRKGQQITFGNSPIPEFQKQVARLVKGQESVESLLKKQE